jgi:hypothetical protein
VGEVVATDQERAAMLVAVEYFLGLAQIMPAHWIRPGVVTDCIDLADKLGPKTRDEKHRIPGSVRASVAKHLRKLGLRAPQMEEGL